MTAPLGRWSPGQRWGGGNLAAGGRGGGRRLRVRASWVELQPLTSSAGGGGLRGAAVPTRPSPSWKGATRKGVELTGRALWNKSHQAEFVCSEAGAGSLSFPSDRPHSGGPGLPCGSGVPPATDTVTKARRGPESAVPPPPLGSDSTSWPAGSRCGGRGLGSRGCAPHPHPHRPCTTLGRWSALTAEGGPQGCSASWAHRQTEGQAGPAPGPSAPLWRHEALQMSTVPNQLDSHSRGLPGRPPLFPAPPFLSPWPESRASWTQASDWQRGTIRERPGGGI